MAVSNRLRLVCRLSGGSNNKPRPTWFSKSVCIDSVVAAAARVRAAGVAVDMWLVIDLKSGINESSARDRYARDFDRVIGISGGSAAKSWRATLALPGLIDGVELVYFVEDDHLHTSEALVRLVSGRADYRFLYASDEDLASHPGPHRDGWRAVGSGVTSFAATAHTLRKDLRAHRLFSHSGRGWDEVTFRALGGGAPALGSGARYVAQPLSPSLIHGWRDGVGGIRHATFRSAAILSGIFIKRSIAALIPSAATHAEPALLSFGTDWAAVAAGVQQERGELP